MKKHIYDEKSGLTYTLTGDCYLPDLTLPEVETAAYGKYGFLRLNYLKEYKRGLYVSLLTQGKLVEHLNCVEEEAGVRIERLMEKMKKSQKITEQLKADEPMKWVGAMNNIKNVAEEIVLQELIYI